MINGAVKEPGSTYSKGSYSIITNPGFDSFYDELLKVDSRISVKYDQELHSLLLEGYSIRLRGVAQRRLCELFSDSKSALRIKMELDDLVLDWDPDQPSITRRKPYDAAHTINESVHRQTGGAISQIFSFEGMKVIYLDVK